MLHYYVQGRTELWEEIVLCVLYYTAPSLKKEACGLLMLNLKLRTKMNMRCWIYFLLFRLKSDLHHLSLNPLSFLYLKFIFGLNFTLKFHVCCQYRPFIFEFPSTIKTKKKKIKLSFKSKINFKIKKNPISQT